MGDLIAGLEKALGVLTALLFSLGAYVWRKTDKKVEDMATALSATASKSAFDAHVTANKHDMELLSARVDAKADESEMDRQRDNINALFEQDTKLRQEMHANQITVMNTLTTIATQVAHISGKLDK